MATYIYIFTYIYNEIEDAWTLWAINSIYFLFSFL